MKIGYSSDSYPDKRNIIDIVPNFDYVKVYDINKILLYMYFLANKKLLHRPTVMLDLDFSFNDLNLNHVDILHFFNKISFGKTPWITTFETIVPRFNSTLSCNHGQNCSYSSLIHDKKILRALEALSSDACKQIIAISECNLNMQKDFLRHFPQYHSKIEHKLICLHPPQKIIVDNYENKGITLKEQIHFIFVGSSFFRKGGIEILEAFQESKKNYGYNLKLTIVSSLKIDNYATKEKEKDIKIAKDIIHKNSDWIDYYDRLPNQKVIELMKSAHIGLLPTYADTYGYSVLEFQATGCPVISTNVRALPEINSNEIGWIIEIPKNHLGEAIYTTKEDRAKISRTIKKELMSIITEIMGNRQVILSKTNAALKHIRNHHSPEEFSRKLGEIYHRALQQNSEMNPNN